MGLFDRFLNPGWFEIKKLPTDLMAEVCALVVMPGTARHITRFQLVDPFLAELRQIGIDLPINAGSGSVTTEVSERLLDEALVGCLKCVGESWSSDQLFKLIPADTVLDGVGCLALASTNDRLGRTKPNTLDQTDYSEDPNECRAQLLVAWARILELDPAAFISRVRLGKFDENWDILIGSFSDAMVLAMGRVGTEIIAERARSECAEAPRSATQMIRFLARGLRERGPRESPTRRQVARPTRKERVQSFKDTGRNNSRREQATALIEAQKFDDAISILDAAVSEDSEDWNSWYLLGQCHRFKSEFDRAVQCLKRASSLRPEEASVLLALGIAQQLNWQLDESAKTLNDAIASCPNMTSLYNSLGFTYGKMGRDEEAIETYERGLQALSVTIIKGMRNSAESEVNSLRPSTNQLWLEYAIHAAMGMAVASGADSVAWPSDAMAAEEERTHRHRGLYWTDGQDSHGQTARTYLPNYFNTFCILLRQDPVYANLTGNQGMALQRLERLDEAERHLEEAEEFASTPPARASGGSSIDEIGALVEELKESALALHHEVFEPMDELAKTTVMTAGGSEERGKALQDSFRLSIKADCYALALALIGMRRSRGNADYLRRSEYGALESQAGNLMLETIRESMAHLSALGVESNRTPEDNIPDLVEAIRLAIESYCLLGNQAGIDQALGRFNSQTGFDVSDSDHVKKALGTN